MKKKSLQGVAGSQDNIQAETLLLNNRLEEARAAYVRICQRNGRDADAWLTLGSINGQLGRYADAFECIRKALALNNRNPAAHYSLALLQQQAGRTVEAIASYRSAIRLNPGFAEACYNLATLLYQQGDIEGALEHFRTVGRFRPGMAEVHVAVAKILNEQGSTEAALTECHKALEANPKWAPALVNYGIIQKEEGLLAEAEATLERALAIDGNDAETWFQLGNVFSLQEKTHQAMERFHRAIQLNPGHAGANYNLGVAALDIGEPEDAVRYFRVALSINPAYAEAYYGLGEASLSQGALDEAVAYYREALKYRPDFAEAYASLGNVLHQQGFHADGVAALNRSLELNPESVDAHVNLASALITTNQLDQAMEHYETASRLDPADDRPVAGVAGIHERRSEFQTALDLIQSMIKGAGTTPRVAMVYARLSKQSDSREKAAELLESCLTQQGVGPQDGIDMHFLLGDLYDKLKGYDKAFEHYRKGNESFRKVCAKLVNEYSTKIEEERFQRIMDTYSRDFMENAPRSGNISDRPVFVVGMPRSGTTLTEQILSSHPQVFGAGELNDIFRLARSGTEKLDTELPYPDCMSAVTATFLDSIADAYLEKLESLNSVAVRVIDKMPHNFLQLGLIALLFPKAHVIHIQRNPIDTCLSIYFQKFNTSHTYASSLSQLGAYYRLYQSIMAHWRKVLDISLLEIKYDELVAGQERVSREMIDFCGLEWDPACLDFHATRRDVITPSYDQVRRPMYRQSSGRWKNYQPYIGELIKALG